MSGLLAFLIVLLIVVSCDVPDNYTNETIETELDLLGYNIDEISYMTATNIELLDERGA